MKKEVYFTETLLTDLHLRFCGYEDCERNFEQYMHARYYWLFHLVTKGEGVYICNNISYDVKKAMFLSFIPMIL